MPKPVSQLPVAMECGAASRRLQICFVYSRLPFPMMRGDQLTVSHLLSFLAARGHTVDFFTIDTDGMLSREQRQWLHTVCREVRFYPQSLWAKLKGVIRFVIQLKPIQVGMFWNARLAKEVGEGIRQKKYDIVYAYYLRSAPIVPKGLPPGTVSFLALQLSQTLNTERLFLNEKSLWKKLVYWLERWLVARYEARIWKNFTRVVLIGPKDVEAIQAACRTGGLPEMDNWVYGAHGTDTCRFIPAAAEEVVEGRVVFSGSMLYAPNVQAVTWFASECWPKIRKARPDAELIIQGRDPLPQILQLDGRDGIRVTGTVPDVGAYIRSAAVCIAPIRAAGGMQNKLIEYMASAKAVVATSIANEGIMAPQETLVIADTSDDFVREVLALLDDKERAREIGRRAREYVLANWTWEAHFLKLEENMYAALDGKSPAR